jgi:hypothetical protein
MPMTDLESRLVDLGSRIEWPEADVAGAVRTRITAGPPRRLRPVWVVATTVVAVCLLVVGTPGGRSAVADVLGGVGIEIRWGDGGPIPVSHRDLALGEEVTIDVAIDAVEHDLLLPRGDVGPPDGIYLDGTRVSTLWLPRATLPEVGDSGVGLLHMQFIARLDIGLLSKQLQDGSDVSAVQVRGETGFWIEGKPHVLAYVDPDGGVRTDATRLAENVLVWEEAGVTHRLESALSLDETRAVAESLSPVDPGGSASG